MDLISVNIGREQAIHNAKISGVTGIYKIAVDHPIQITSLGITGDFISDIENHGGPDQAIYIYGSADYEWWKNALGKDLLPGTFGENLTISELESATFSIGDRLHIGAAVLEVTAPRIPCVTLAARMDDPEFVKRFRYAERPGLYCRVIQEGAVKTGDPVIVEPYTGETITTLEMFREFYTPHLTEETLRRHLRAPIAIRARQDKEKQLQKLLVSSSR